MENYALIPARAGSKGCPGKNMRKLGGKTLIQRAIECAQAAGIRNIIVSTDIPELVLPEDVLLYRRPAALCADTASLLDVARHHAEYLGQARLVILQPNSPFRTPKNVCDALAALNSRVDAVLSVRLAQETRGRLFDVLQPGRIRPMGDPVPQRQDAPDKNALYFSGSVVVLNTSSFMKCEYWGDRLGYVQTTWLEGFDVDTEEDWWLAELLERGINNGRG